jgi:hypothetical protein
MFLTLTTSLRANKIIFNRAIKRYASSIKDKFTWLKFTYDVSHFKFTPGIIRSEGRLAYTILKPVVANFFNKKIKNIPKGNLIKVILRAKLIEHDTKKEYIRTLSRLQIVNIDDSDLLLSIFAGRLIAMSDIYDKDLIEKFIISYQISDDKNLKPLYQLEDDFTPTYSTFGSYNLPTDKEHSLWGDVLHNSKNKTTIADDNYIYVVTIKKNERHVEVLKNNVKIFTFVDSFRDNDAYYIRYIESHIYHISVKEGKVIFKKTLIKTNYMQTSKKDLALKDKFITFDIETYNNEGQLVPYVVSFYDGHMSWSYNLQSFNSPEAMLKEGISSIMKRKYHGYSVYAHNFSNFDGIFMIRVLASLGTVSPIINKGQLVKTTFEWKGDNMKSGRPYKLYFKDSYLILKGSLSSLAKSFGVENKGMFPITFANVSNLDYIGDVTGMSFFNNISLSEYEDYKSEYNNNWNLMEETIKYCERDCRVLHQVLTKFNDLIFNNYGLNIHSYPTLPGLAMAIFKTNYLKIKNLPLLTKTIFNDI